MHRTTLTVRLYLIVGLVGLCCSTSALWARDVSLVHGMSIADEISFESRSVDGDISLSFDQAQYALETHEFSSRELSNLYGNTYAYWNNSSAYIEHKLFYLLTHAFMHSNMVNFFPDPMVRLNQHLIDNQKPQCNGFHFQIQSRWQSYGMHLEYRF